MIHGHGFHDRRRKFGSGSAPVVLPTLTRVPISAVTDGGSVTADATAVLNSSANKANGKFTTTTSARDFRITLGTITGNNGAMLWLDTYGNGMNNASYGTLSLSYSTDGGATFPNSLPFTLFSPAGDTGYANRGQYAAIPSAASGMVLKLTFTSNANVNMAIGIVNLDTNKAKNAVFIGTGTSVEQQGWGAQGTIDKIIAANPTADVLFFNWGRTGGKLADIYTECVSQIAATLPFCGYLVGLPWENEMFQVTRNTSPYIYAGDTTAAKSHITGMSSTWSAYTTANSINPVYAAATFSNYLLNSPIAGAPAVDQAAASGGPFPAKGNAPFNQNEIATAIQAASSSSWDSSLGIARLDAFSRSLVSWENWLTSVDGVHPATAGAPIHKQNVVDAATYWLTGSWPLSYIERLIATYEGNGGAPASVVTRISYAMSQWPTATGGQVTARAALTTRLNAIPTTYTDPTLTGAAVLPSAMTTGGVQDWFNFADFTKLTVGQCGTNGSAPLSMDTVGMVSAVASRGSTASSLIQSSTVTPSVRPVFVPKGAASGVRGVLNFNDTDIASTSGVVLNGSGASLIGALDAGNPELLIGLVWAPTQQAKTILQFTAGASNLRIAMASGVYGLARIIDTATVIATDPGTDVAAGTWLCTVIGCNGSGSWFIDRNGVQVASGTRTISARTGSAFTLGSGSAGKFQEAVILTGAGASGNRAALNAYLRQASGVY